MTVKDWALSVLKFDRREWNCCTLDCPEWGSADGGLNDIKIQASQPSMEQCNHGGQRHGWKRRVPDAAARSPADDLSVSYSPQLQKRDHHRQDGHNSCPAWCEWNNLLNWILLRRFVFSKKSTCNYIELYKTIITNKNVTTLCSELWYYFAVSQKFVVIITYFMLCWRPVGKW